ncbi:GGDEF domain-containing protein [Cognatishimia sp. SS12]|uniref:GGDEF domain-containing protein n=1 Tax=Cognatishimia sp. SS12 TaxID=2979465 RepID=UPI00232BFAA8|nr:GGDEF domain-containing protein [Cognatishimia sp. SS12]MDC0736694.1 GGDEF domain-containing protein [Cognatishimia sp. SS12]
MSETHDITAMADMFDVICPMHLLVNADQTIAHVGPTLAKLSTGGPPKGRAFFDMFEITRPSRLKMSHAIFTETSTRVHLRLRHARDVKLQAIVAPAPMAGMHIVNLGFGISLRDAVRRFHLNSSDFAPTDLAVEMLYLVEAKSAAMEASRKLNRRLQAEKAVAETQAYTDTLTGLKNRRAVDHILQRFLAAGVGFALMQLDLDFFKTVNDTRGHAAGDYVLQQVARILREETRALDEVARIGGDEFVLLFQGNVDETLLTSIAERIISRVQEPIFFKGDTCTISASIGIAPVRAGTVLTAQQVFANADLALYASKENGRGRYTVFTRALRRKAQIKKAEDAQKDASDAA